MRTLLQSLLRGKGRAVLKWLWMHFLFLTGLLSWARQRIGRQGGIVVLTFHRVLPEDQYGTTNSPAGMSLRQKTFEALTRYVSRHYPVVPLSGEEPVWTTERQRPRIAFTFDDGWIDNGTVAAPIAQRYGIPLTIFICPEKIGSPLPFWPERVTVLVRAVRSSAEAIRKAKQILAARPDQGTPYLKALESDEALKSLISSLKGQAHPESDEVIVQMRAVAGGDDGLNANGTADSTMTWDDIHSLREAGVTFGSHTQSHPILTHIPIEDAEREITDSKREIQEQVGSQCLLFSYPNGDWCWNVRSLVNQAGYKFAFTNRPGTWTAECDPLLIPRVNVWEGSVAGLFGGFSRIAFEYSTFWKIFRAQRRRRTDARDLGRSCCTHVLSYGRAELAAARYPVN